jgi:hypothetical protein
LDWKQPPFKGNILSIEYDISKVVMEEEVQLVDFSNDPTEVIVIFCYSGSCHVVDSLEECLEVKLDGNKGGSSGVVGNFLGTTYKVG